MEAVRVKVKEEVMIVVDDLDGIGGGMVFEEDEEKREKVDEIYCGSGGGGMTFEEKFEEIDGGSGGGSGGEVTFEDEVEKKDDEIDGGGSGGGDGVVKLEQQAPIVKYNGGGGGGEIEIKEEEKLELDEVDVNGGGGGGGGSGGSSDSSSSIRLPKPMSGLHDFTPPPFLTKTYEMVEDPATDFIVSWNVGGGNGGGKSFIVWDDIEFSTTLLPRYFKHSNFSSFIRQLNTYGFRKVHHDRWEFANEAFLRGKRNLLKNIKRRQVGLSSSNLQQEAKNVAEMAKIELGTQVESLKKDQNLLQVEILKLRQQQETSENHIAAFERRIQCSAFSHQKLVCFFRKTVGCPNFMEKMKRRQRREQGCCGCGRCGGGGIEKRRRLVNGTNQVGLLPKDTTAQYASMDDIHHHQQQQPQQQPSGSCPVPDHITNVKSARNVNSSSNSPQYDNLFLEKIKEDLFDESEADEVPSGGSNSSYLHDLQDLIMTSDWNNYAQLVEEQILES